MSRTKRLKLVVFDMAGTTVDDVIDGVPLVLKSYDEAFRVNCVEVPMEVLNEQRGRDKWAVISELGGEKAKEIFTYFNDMLLANTNKVKEIQGTSETFRYLRSQNIKVALNTGFPHEVAKGIIEHMVWERDGLIDSWTCSEDVGKSRPDPAMIFALMNRHNVEDPSTVMKIDDTAKGIEEGLNAGAVTLGVLTGTQTKERLLQAKPYDIIESVRHLPDYLKTKGYL